MMKFLLLSILFISVAAPFYFNRVIYWLSTLRQTQEEKELHRELQVLVSDLDVDTWTYINPGHIIHKSSKIRLFYGDRIATKLEVDGEYIYPCSYATKRLIRDAVEIVTENHNKMKRKIRNEQEIQIIQKASNKIRKNNEKKAAKSSVDKFEKISEEVIKEVS